MNLNRNQKNKNDMFDCRKRKFSNIYLLAFRLNNNIQHMTEKTVCSPPNPN